MAKDLTKIMKGGVNGAVLAAVNSSGAIDATTLNKFPMKGYGLLRDDMLKAKSTELKLRTSGGNEIQQGFDIEATIGGMQGASGDIANFELFENQLLNDLFLFGPSQTHRLKNLSTVVQIETELSPKGEKGFSTRHKGFYDSITNFELAKSLTNYLTSPAYQYYQVLKNIRSQNLVFAVYPYLGTFNQPTKLYDASINRYVATLYNSPTWAFAPDANYSILTFDGINDYADFGNILNDDGVSDLLIEAWVYILGADGTTVNIFGNKNNNDNNAGFVLYRNASNQPAFRIADGSGSAIPVGSNLLQNIWKHVAITIDRNGLGTVYLNSLSGGTPTLVSTVSTAASSNSLKIGASVSTYGNSSIGALRVYNFGAGGLPANVATIITNHYNAEKSIFGL